ncbi:hypothetical protein DDV98_00145 [Streptomyces sp. IB2014 011-12]|nr:hypothetical protein DDV98_00145 [Streptomyces sp. IB2014 011-12]
MAVGESGRVPDGVLVRREPDERELRHQHIRQQRQRMRRGEPYAQVLVGDPRRAVRVEQGGQGAADAPLRDGLGQAYGRCGHRAGPRSS